jgi:hypothetical protein
MARDPRPGRNLELELELEIGTGPNLPFYPGNRRKPGPGTRGQA